ncbi:MAG: YhbY family RNA-binding protein [Nitrososphaerota archaeon]|nr:YhbY family RNA-binding protein [Candidatus Bathyarchaeota archaeon]MDW8194004.1 YhbY family RNA-binding protein [Nitrososphaerota archaeon]
MLTPRMKRRIKREFMTEKPTIWIGKNRISHDVIEEIKKQLDKREIVKIKVLKTALGEVKTDEIASAISKETEAALVEVRGHTIVLYKRQKGKQK